MSIALEETFRLAMVNDAGVSALVGARFFLVQLPQGPTFPCVRYQRISTTPFYSQQLGGSNATMGWARFQLDILVQGKSGATYSGKQTDEIARAIITALSTFNASALLASPSVLTQAPNFLLSRRMGIQPGTQPPIYMDSMDVKLYYLEQ